MLGRRSGGDGEQRDLGRRVEAQAEQEDDRRVAQREEESNAQRLLPLLEQLARGVVDGRDMVGIEGMAKTVDVRQATETQHERVTGRDQDQHDAPTDEVEQGDAPE